MKDKVKELISKYNEKLLCVPSDSEIEEMYSDPYFTALWKHKEKVLAEVQKRHYKEVISDLKDLLAKKVK